EGHGDTARAAEIRYGSLRYLEEQRRDLEQQHASLPPDQLVASEVHGHHIAEVIAEKTGIPINRLLENERERLLHLETRISSRVIAQSEAVASVANAVRRMRTDLRIG